jgi:hypothetical protein
MTGGKNCFGEYTLSIFHFINVRYRSLRNSQHAKFKEHERALFWLVC